MAQSYFSRLVRSGGSVPLVPARPVSSLWKTARIDATSAAEHAESMPLLSARRSTARPISSPDRAQPVDWTQAESPPSQPSPLNVKPRASRTREPRTSIPHETIHATPTVATSDKNEPVRQETFRARKPELTIPVDSGLTGLPSGVAEILQKQFPPATSRVPTVLFPRESPAQPPVDPSSAGRSAEAKPVPAYARQSGPIGPNRLAEPAALLAADQPQPMRGSGSMSQEDASSAARTNSADLMAEASDPTRRPEARFRPPDLTIPARPRELPVTARQNSIPEETRSKTNTVQIGRIEVQVVPPPASSYRPAPPAPPKARLARGYALWPGW